MATTGWLPQPLSFLLCCFFTLTVVLGEREVSSAHVSLSNVTDQFALLSFKSRITKDPYNVLSNWNSNISFCNWNGVSCDRGAQRVVSLNLTNRAVEGTLSPYIGNLSFLHILDLTKNSFYGHVPIDFSRLPQLEYLSFIRNHFEGLIPQSLVHCGHLQFLSILENQFIGSIPEFVGSLPELKLINFYGNRLTGTIPIALGNLSNLEFLNIGQNHIHGKIPSQLGSLTCLTFFNLELNNLTGTLPDSLLNLSAIQSMSFTHNQLTGHLPKNAGCFLPDLRRLLLGNNNFDGPLPSSLSNATRLELLTMESNQFNGPIPMELGSLSQLRLLSLERNMFTSIPGNRELSFLVSLTKCQMLEEVFLSLNLLKGTLPPSIGNLSTTLWRFHMSGNQIEGTIPSAIGNLTNLMSLRLNGNKIKGPIPPNIGLLNNLQELILSGNALEGLIPMSLYQLVHMPYLYMHNNMLTGPISKSINNLTSLQELDLSSNNLSSEIPSGLCELKVLVLLNLQDNSFTGHLPLDFEKMTMLDKMDISRNKLTGEIPLSLSKLQMLEYLNLSRNTFQGHIPEKIDGMVNIRAIDLSHNKLSGEIPKSLEKLQHIQILDLSFNQLEGEIPSGGSLTNLSAESFLGNYALCGSPKFHVPACLNRTKRHKQSTTTRVIATCAIGGIALLVIVCMLIGISCYRKRESLKPNNVESLQGITHPMISYRELLHATRNFSDANLLGSGSFGSVYKAILIDGAIVAVKVLNLLFDGASNSFDIECNVMRQIRHRNLVKVITSCSNRDFKALVLQYMPLGNLEAWLHSDTYHLNLFQRLDIMIDVACALEYLHHGYSETIVHCDLKPSNILLDENMTAYVGDFGIAKMLVGHKSSTLTTTLGTTGYIAPEFGMSGKVSTKADVYSYGILLLEVFTSRKPTDAQFEGDLSLRQWIAEAFPVAISDVIDSHLLEEDNTIETGRSAPMNELLVMIMEIGLTCSRESPTARMDMKEVAVALKKIQEKAN